MDSFVLVNEAREAEFQKSKYDFIKQSNKAEMTGTASESLSVRSSIVYLLHCPNLGVFNWLCLSGLPQLIY